MKTKSEKKKISKVQAKDAKKKLGGGFYVYTDANGNKSIRQIDQK